MKKYRLLAIDQFDGTERWVFETNDPHEMLLEIEVRAQVKEWDQVHLPTYLHDALWLHEEGDYPYRVV